MDTDSIVLSVNTKAINNDSKSLFDAYDFSNLSENNVIFCEENKKFIGNFERETPKSFWIYEFI